jgi:hypothetical protein
MKISYDNEVPNKGIQLELGTVRHRASPNTFYLPREDERMNIPVGYYVQLIFKCPPGNSSAAAERMWVKVTEEVSPGHYKGTLASNPIWIKQTEYGAIIEFSSEHVIDVTKPENAI